MLGQTSSGKSVYHGVISICSSYKKEPAIKRRVENYEMFSIFRFLLTLGANFLQDQIFFHRFTNVN